LPINLRTQIDLKIARILKMSTDDQPDKGSNTAKGNQQTAPKSVILPPSSPVESPVKENQNPKKGFFERWKHEIEFAGLLGLIFYCVVNWLEWRTFDSERKTMEREFLSGQTNATKQLVALQGQLDEMQKDRNLDQRAWIDPYQVTRWSDDNFTNSFYYIVRFKNIGKTPAIRTFGEVNVETNFNPIYIPTPIPTPLTNISAGVVFPDIENIIQSPTMPISILADAFTEKHSLWIYGIEQYEDISGKDHWIRYCWVIDVRTGVQYPAVSGNDCDTNN
jgi:hypothetical protein